MKPPMKSIAARLRFLTEVSDRISPNYELIAIAAELERMTIEMRFEVDIEQPGLPRSHEIAVEHGRLWKFDKNYADAIGCWADTLAGKK